MVTTVLVGIAGLSFLGASLALRPLLVLLAAAIRLAAPVQACWLGVQL
jgi:hypothetical protein